MARLHGQPCWYELMTTKGGLEKAEAFYAEVLGWSYRDASMEGFAYHLASAGDDMVAAAMEPPPDVGDMPPFWMIYFAVENADKAAADVEAAGGSVHRPPEDIPGTGRFAIFADPLGAAFGILEPEPMEGGGAGHAFDQTKAGHGSWNELMTSDPEAGFGFYADLFGWESAMVVDMGEMGPYRIFSHDGGQIGGVMGLGNAPAPCWLPYFGVRDVEEAIGRIEAAGGKHAFGPIQVPGGSFIAVGQDSLGAWFAVVGPKEG
ncbi:VOC family protein [Amaricoccus sp. W119]|uniref:VOC family protein n=1 Tax=Amaricoccus sp. W119 TaxID=3391833 RepID=UPI0039A46A2A